MRIYHDMLGKNPTHSNSRIRNYLATPELGASCSTVHENVLGPGVVVPLHSHDAVEEIIVCLQGQAECTLDGQSPLPYEAGSVLIIPAGTRHTIRNTGSNQLRQLSFFPAPSADTRWIEPESRLG